VSDIKHVLCTCGLQQQQQNSSSNSASIITAGVLLYVNTAVALMVQQLPQAQEAYDK
jgi:hypothetical protein